MTTNAYSSNFSPAGMLKEKHRRSPLLFVVLFVASAASIASIVTDVFLYLVASCIAILLAYFFMKDARVRFVSTLGITVLLNIRPGHITAGYFVIDYFAAVLFTGGLLYVIIKNMLILRRSIAPDKLFLFFILFLVWGSLLGIFGVIHGTITFEGWFREILLFTTPLFLFPVFYLEMIEEGYDAEKVLMGCLLAAWAMAFATEVIKIRSNLVGALYLFQIGAARNDTTNGLFMMHMFLSFAMARATKRSWLLYAGFCISFISLILTFERAAWISGTVFLAVVIFLGDRVERKRGYRFLMKILFIFLLVLTIGYLRSPLLRTAILYSSSKVTTVANMGKDRSMYNRFVEWRNIGEYITSSPIFGYGFGAQFKNYDWLLGYSNSTGFTHNTYLGILFKAGILGFILLFIPVFGYIIKGIKYARSNLVSLLDRAYLRAGIATMMHLLFTGWIGNFFGGRGTMFCIAIFWCYVLSIEQKVAQNNQKEGVKSITAEY